jgi:hypothetical protein
MKKIVIIAMALLVNFAYVKPAASQGLLEQNKFYKQVETPNSQMKMFKDTAQYQDLKTLSISVTQENKNNKTAADSITSLIKQFQYLSATKTKTTSPEITQLQNQIEILNKQLAYTKTQAADAIRNKNKSIADNLISNLKNYKAALDGYQKNIADIRDHRDTNNVSELQRLRDSTALVLLPFVTHFQNQLDSLNNYSETFKSLADKTDSSNYLANDTLCNNLFTKINMLDTNSIKNTKINIENINKNYSDKYNKILTAIIESNKSTSEQLGTVPGFSTLLNSPEVIPEISVLAGKSFGFNTSDKRFHFSGEIKLFTTASASSTKDSAEFSDRQKVFIQSASNYGLVSQFTISCVKSRDSSFKHLAGNLSVNFLGKNFKTDTINQFNVAALNMKAGLEWAFWTGLSAYGNINSMMFLTNIDYLNSYLQVSRNKTYWFFDVGSKVLLDLTSDKTVGLNLDLNLVIMNPSLQHNIYPSKDPVVASLKIGVRKIF